MATLTHPKGRTVVVPDDVVKSYTDLGWTVAGDKPAPVEPPVVIPEGDPSEAWSAKELAAYAERENVDVSGAKKKAEVLAVLAKVKTPAPVEPPVSE